MTKTATPDIVDLHVGSRIRLRRKALNVSQEVLAQRLGLTFQQVQKYEKGTNRVSASKLFAIAHALDCPVAHFFDGLASPPEQAPDTDLSMWLRSKDAVTLAMAALGLPEATRKVFITASVNIAASLAAASDHVDHGHHAPSGARQGPLAGGEATTPA